MLAKKNPENVVLVYTGGRAVFGKNMKEINVIHQLRSTPSIIYPKSKIVTQAVTDLHHLRVCDKSVNSRRGNHPFTEGKGEAKLIGSAWYPGDEWKGDVARMVFISKTYAIMKN